MQNGGIAVIGANQCGLAFAYFAAQAGFKVSVYEKKMRLDVPYSWADEVPISMFEKLGFDEPASLLSGEKPKSTLISPDGRYFITLPQSKKNPLIPVNRAQLNSYLYEKTASAGAEFHYGCEVKSAIVKRNTVCGLLLSDGSEVSFDMVVDCSGAFSCVRSGLPDLLHIPQKANPDDMFFAKRIFFEREQGSPSPDFPRKIYVKHNGESGISWCWLSLDGKAADVLIGRCGSLEEKSLKQALESIKKENPIVSDKILSESETCIIPVRRTISRMFANGYALVGDSAYMTIPLMGSGILCGMLAAKILCEVLSKPVGEPFSAENLYRYQRRYFNEIGALFAGAEKIKNHFIKGDAEEINKLMSKSDKINMLFQNVISGKYGSSARESAEILLSYLKKPDLASHLGAEASKAVLVYAFSRSLPKRYDDKQLYFWQLKYDEYFST